LEELEELEENRIRYSDDYLFFLPIVFQYLPDAGRTRCGMSMDQSGRRVFVSPIAC
jgi:hypothetical protein